MGTHHGMHQCRDGVLLESVDPRCPAALYHAGVASDLERAIQASKRFEAALTKRFGAQGRGLHEKVSSVERKLNAQVIKDLRLIATVRNKLVHEEGYDQIERQEAFDAACQRAGKALGVAGRKWPLPMVLGLLLLLLGVLGVVLVALFQLGR